MSVIKTPSSGLSIRPVAPYDEENIWKGLSDPLVTQFYGVSFSKREDISQQMDWYEGLAKNGTGIWWVIENSEMEFLGAAGFNDLDRQAGKAEIGFWLLNNYWGKGIMSEALPVLINHAWENLDLNQIEAFVETGNHASSKLLQKLGFTWKELLENHEIKNGKSIDLDVFVLQRT